MNKPMETLTQQLGKTIRTKRRTLGLTQEQLAEMLGVGHQALSRIEQGKMAPKMDRLPCLAESLQCSVPDLFRSMEGAEPRHAQHIEEMLRVLPMEKQEFVVRHLSGLIALLRLK